jgi:hypothetical protein
MLAHAFHLKKRNLAAKVPVTALKAMFGKHPTTISVEEMNATIARRGAAAK